LGGTTRRARIVSITQQLADLTRELETLLLTESSDEEPQAVTEFEIGDTVVINNSYKGLQGATGKVITVTKNQVEIKLSSNQIVRRNKTNVTKVL
jgi:ribosomal protein L21E